MSQQRDDVNVDESEERAFEGEQEDQVTAEERAQEARNVKPAIDESLAAGKKVTPQGVVLAAGLATAETVKDVPTLGMTLPSLSTEAGVAADGSVVDDRADRAMDFHRAVTGQQEVDDDFEVFPGVTRKRMREASQGIPQEGAPEDDRRIVLVDNPGALGGALITSTVKAEQPTPPPTGAETQEGND